jgi:hypothetical protein
MMFATSWLFTMFAHDVENFSALQRLYDAVIAGGPAFINHVIMAVIKENQGALTEYH